MWQNMPDDNRQAIELCVDLAHGGSVQPYVDGTLQTPEEFEAMRQIRVLWKQPKSDPPEQLMLFEAG
jgi:hypothetical protein